MNKEDIVKLLDGNIYYRFEYCDFLYQKLEHLQNLIDKATNYYLKELSKRGSIDEVAVEMFNLLEGNK